VLVITVGIAGRSQPSGLCDFLDVDGSSQGLSFSDDDLDPEQIMSTSGHSGGPRSESFCDLGFNPEQGIVWKVPRNKDLQEDKVLEYVRLLGNYFPIRSSLACEERGGFHGDVGILMMGGEIAFFRRRKIPWQMDIIKNPKELS